MYATNVNGWGTDTHATHSEEATHKYDTNMNTWDTDTHVKKD